MDERNADWEAPLFTHVMQSTCFFHPIFVIRTTRIILEDSLLVLLIRDIEAVRTRQGHFAWIAEDDVIVYCRRVDHAIPTSPNDAIPCQERDTRDSCLEEFRKTGGIGQVDWCATSRSLTTDEGW